MKILNYLKLGINRIETFWNWWSVSDLCLSLILPIWFLCLPQAWVLRTMSWNLLIYDVFPCQGQNRSILETLSSIFFSKYQPSGDVGSLPPFAMLHRLQIQTGCQRAPKGPKKTKKNRETIMEKVIPTLFPFPFDHQTATDCNATTCAITPLLAMRSSSKERV